MSIRVAVAQLNSRQVVAENLEVCGRLVAEASRQGVELVAFPENAPYLGREVERLSLAEPVEGAIGSAFRAMAREHGVAIVLGSMAETGPDPGHSYNTSIFIDEKGEYLGVYRKIHLFDVEIEGGPSFQESASVAAGSREVLVKWRGAGVGMSVCYDLRFPELYRRLRVAGADVLTVPSAFTRETGPDHWELLLRARAVENQCYVIAPNQWGEHISGRHSHGRSMIVDPWGVVVAQVGGGVGLAVGKVDLGRVAQVRAGMPCLEHARLLG